MNFYTLNRGLHRRLHHYYMFKSREKLYHEKIDRMIKEGKARPLKRNEKAEVQTYFSSFGIKNISTKWHQYYTGMTGRFDKKYIPEDIFFNVIEPNLNMISLSNGLTDKNLLDKLFANIKQPTTVLKKSNGIFYNDSSKKVLTQKEALFECGNRGKLIIKPSIDSGGGKNVVVFETDGNTTDYLNMSLTEFLEQYFDNFIIQEFEEQNEEMSSLNPTSLNTLRIVTLLMDSSVVVLSSGVRIGGLGAKVDNASQGGMYCRANDSGQLDRQGYYFSSKRTEKTDSNVLLKNFTIPNYSEAISKVKELHKSIPHFKMVSWDVALDKNKDLVLIEYNIRSQDINLHQVVNGPIFGKYTDQILSNYNEKRLFSSRKN